jgi:hypothetical protein
VLQTTVPRPSTVVALGFSTTYAAGGPAATHSAAVFCPWAARSPIRLLLASTAIQNDDGMRAGSSASDARDGRRGGLRRSRAIAPRAVNNWA